MTKKLLYITFGNTGGGGKSTAARLVHFFAEETGRTAQIVDADPGNRSVSRVISTSDAIVFGAKASVGAEIVKFRGDVDVLIIDCGANSSTDTYDIVPLLKAADEEGRPSGRHTVGLVPVSPNKPGAVGSARAARDAFVQAGLDVHVILNNVDGSSNFVADREGGIEGVPLPRLEPGIMAVLNLEQQSFKESLVHPPAGFERAMDYAADWLQKCSALPAFAPYFGFDAAPLDLGRQKPKPRHFLIEKLSAARDQRLSLNEQIQEHHAAFMKELPMSVQFLKHALGYRDAFLEYART